MERLLATLRRALAGLEGRAVVAVSGGADSLALLAGLVLLQRRGETGLLPTAAHLDHGLQAESAAPAARAAAFARDRGVPFVQGRVRLARGPDLEARARAVRYAFLHQVAREQNARFVLTAHHRDDQAETVWARLGRGAGLHGLRGLLGRRPLGGAWLIRPFLTLTQEELRRAAQEARLPWWSDPMNRDLRFQRVRIRALLRHLAAQDPELPAALARLAGRAEGALACLARKAAPLLADLLAPLPGGIHYPGPALAVARRRWRTLAPPLQSLALTLLLRHLAPAAPPLLGEPGLRALARALGGGKSWLAPVPLRRHLYLLADAERAVLALAPPRLLDPPFPPRAVATAVGPGWLRPPRRSDRFWPPGWPRPVRVEAYLARRGLPALRRRTVPVLVVGEAVAAIPGYGRDRRFPRLSTDAVEGPRDASRSGPERGARPRDP